jgi:hypothetical protein
MSGISNLETQAEPRGRVQRPPAAAADIHVWLDAFKTRYMLQPPEFTEISNVLGYFRDMYRDETQIIGRLSGARNPVDSAWFAELIERGSKADLDDLEVVCEPAASSFNKAYLRFLQHELLTVALAKDKRGDTVSPAIPAWFRAKGWRVPVDWHTDRRDGRAALSGNAELAAAAAAAGGGPAVGGLAGTPPGSPRAPSVPAPRVGDLFAEHLSLQARLQAMEEQIKSLQEELRTAKIRNEELDAHNIDLEMEMSRMMAKNAERAAALRTLLGV